MACAPSFPSPGGLGLFTSQQCGDSQAQGNLGFQARRLPGMPSLPSDAPGTLPGKHRLFHLCAEGRKSSHRAKSQETHRCPLSSYWGEGKGDTTDPQASFPSSGAQRRAPDGGL